MTTAKNFIKITLSLYFLFSKVCIRNSENNFILFYHANTHTLEHTRKRLDAHSSTTACIHRNLSSTN